MDYSALLFNGSVEEGTELQRAPVGRVCVPTGRIVCCDPFLIYEVGPLDRIVSPGNYDVDVWLTDLPDWGRRVALATMQFSAGRPAAWRDAVFVVDGHEHDSFRVDAGLAAFMDVSTAVTFERTVQDFYAQQPQGNYYDDVLASEFKRSASDPRFSGDWNLHKPAGIAPLNIAMFASGLGDGSYRPYWGLDENDSPAMLLIDFGLVEPSER